MEMGRKKVRLDEGAESSLDLCEVVAVKQPCQAL